MKLFFSPGATSLAVRIVFHEAGITPEFIQVDLENQRIAATGEPYCDVNPMGKVPALQLDDGSVLTEGAAVLQYVADLRPEARLVPAAGTLERYRLMEALNFLATEVHKGYSAMFDPEVPPAYREQLMQDTRAIRRIIAMLWRGPFMFGDAFTVADAYLYCLLRLAVHAGMDFSPYPRINAFFERVQARASVRACIRAEGLLEA